MFRKDCKMHQSTFMHIFIFSSLVFVFTSAFVVPKPDGKKSRAVDKSLSDEQHYGEEEEHNVDYDHDAFLGDDAKTFDELTPEESRRRLGKMVDKIDKDKDGFVTEKELKEWIRFTQRRYILDDVDRQWKSHSREKDDILTWDEYRRSAYGYLDGLEELDAKDGDENTVAYKEMMEKDKRRWSVADQNKDNVLSKEEFANFLHPEESIHMRDVVVLETMEDVDKDNDGQISLDEYIGDLYPHSAGDNEEEPEWVKNEREQFLNFRDKNKDGFMDNSEVREWIMPDDYDHSEAEARHLVFESDVNKDNKLSKEEIIDKYDLFVGSQATDFGEALVRHDEF